MHISYFISARGHDLSRVALYTAGDRCVGARAIKHPRVKRVPGDTVRVATCVLFLCAANTRVLFVSVKGRGEGKREKDVFKQSRPEASRRVALASLLPLLQLSRFNESVAFLSRE